MSRSDFRVRVRNLRVIVRVSVRNVVGGTSSIEDSFLPVQHVADADVALHSILYTSACVACQIRITSGSAIAEGPREALVSRNPATTKHLT